MRQSWSAWLVALAGCGRLSFDPHSDARNADTNSLTDTDLIPDLIRFPMDDRPEIAGVLAAVPAVYAVPCTSCPIATGDHMVGTGAYQFDGTVRVVLGDVLPARPYTVTVWIKPIATSPFAIAISKPYDTTTLLDDLALTVYDTGFSYEGAQGGQIITVSGNGDIRGAWHHVALVFDGSDRSVYLDGAFASSGAGPWETSGLPVAIGADLDVGAFAYPFTGELDDLRFYSRVLTPAEIAGVRNEL
jgi:hypothetical protein